MEAIDNITETSVSFFDQPQVQVDQIPVGHGVKLGIQRVSNPALGIGGAYGTWGVSYDNIALQGLIEKHLGEPLDAGDLMNLSELGFVNRYHLTDLTEKENVEVEVEVGARFLREAAHASGWEPEEVDAVLVGLTGPVVEDYTERIAQAAGIPESALKVSVHKACDSSVGALQLALNPLNKLGQIARNLAEELYGKKVLVGGIEGLSRLIQMSRDKNALQLFGNGVGIIGVIPGRTMKFLVGKSYEVFDEEGVLAVHMFYPHSKEHLEGEPLVEVTQEGEHYIRVAGLMHEPTNGASVEMAGPMGMVKLFVRSGVQVVRDVHQAYRDLMERLGVPDKSIAVAIVHHANLKINKLKEKHLQKEGIHLSMPWLLSEFGNVSAASNMIAFLRELSSLKPGDHVLLDGFGAGTYYDVLAVELGGPVE